MLRGRQAGSKLEKRLQLQVKGTNVSGAIPDAVALVAMPLQNKAVVRREKADLEAKGKAMAVRLGFIPPNADLPG
jgi:hypothetical protein